ncbi:sensor histidine kinase [Bacillus massiliigorillae]|uniref:sensor histidine kinase n=1 Tax=Bacillus massiliigorillae TaxID=1243664 RepID=UPI0003A4B7A5|nr:sensor histidine kinase [Bacillus massiliigorillae]
MSLNQVIRNFLKAKLGFIAAYCMNTILLIILIYLLSGYSKFIYPITISLFILLVYLLFAAMKFWNFSRKLEDAKLSPNLEIDPLKVEDRLIFEVTNDIHAEYHTKLYKLNSTFKERNALFSQWIHNMKVSIAIIDLAYEKGANQQQKLDYLEDIKEENEKLKTNLEESLNVLRLDEFSRDYIPEKLSLQRLVLDVVNAQKRDFIYQGVFPKVQIDESIEVLTDSKWCKYILKQIISNAIKYSPHQVQKTIIITALQTEQSVELEIQDEGIGIAASDLPRVFDPFFTGENGRKNESATGIGLYMVKTIVKSLGHQISITSIEEKGTKVRLSFLSKV